jgi:hypothetical protein
LTGAAEQDGQPAARGLSAAATKPEKGYGLTVTLLDRAGRPAAAANHLSVLISHLDRGEVFYWGPPGTVTLPEGRYAITADIATSVPGRDPSYSIISVPELLLDRDRVQTLDARAGYPMSVEADDQAAHGGAYDVVVFTRISDGSPTTALRYVFDPRFDEVYAATMPGTRSDTFAFGQARRATEPTLGLTATSPEPFAVRVEWLDYGAQAIREDAHLAALHAGAATAEDLDGLDVDGRLVVVEAPAGLAYQDLLTRLATVSDRGARLVLVIPQDLSSFDVGDTSTLPLPVMIGWGATAERFAWLARAGGLTAAYASRPMPQLRYELAYGVAGQLTAPQVHRPRTTDLAALPTSYHDAAPDAARFINAAMPFFGSTLRAMWSTATAVPQTRVEYYTPGQWELFVSPYGRPSPPVSELRDLRTGWNRSIAWDKAVFGPSLRGTTRTRAGQRPWVWRDGGAIDAILPMFSDAAGRPSTPSPTSDSGSISLFRGDVLVGTVAQPGSARFTVEPPDEPYRLVATVARDQPWWPLATLVSAEWTFRSSADDEGAALPLLTARCDPSVDLRNRAPGGPFAFPLWVERQDCRPVDGTAGVEVSFDDGRIWRPAAMTGSGDRFTAAIVQPGSGFVSLRATVTADNGDTLRQTVIRAYALGH